MSAVVLLLEDNEPLREVLTHFLESSGLSVLATCDPAEAARLAQQRPVDLLITDIALPGTSGDVLAEAICAASPQTRVLFISGEQVAPPGAAFLAKPFTPRQLLEAVGALLG